MDKRKYHFCVFIDIVLEAVVKFIERMGKKDAKLHNYFVLIQGIMLIISGLLAIMNGATFFYFQS